MFSVQSKEGILKEFREGVAAGFNAHPEYLTIEKDMSEGGPNLRNIIRAIRANVIANIPDGIPVPQAVLYITPIGDTAIKMVTITLSSSNKSTEKEFKYSISVMGTDIAKKISDFFVNVYNLLITDYMIESNIEIINALYENIVDAADVSYGIKFTSPLGMNGKKIASLTDNEIVFVVDENEIFGIDNLIIFAEEEEYEKKRKKAIDSIVAEISNSQTTVELVRNYGDDFIRKITQIKTRVRPATYIKNIYSRNIQRAQGNKTVTGYYYENDIFAVVRRDEEGYRVLLSPVDLRTFKTVDYDVIADITEE